jgi:glutamyl-tRNA synthetase
MSPAPRVRIAPSPTGYFHVGTGRTALFNWLFARQRGGVFVLRIEDTDAERSRPEHTRGILAALEWLGLDWDEGPYFQSERRSSHQGAIERLLSAGKAYWCECTRADIDARNRQAGRPAGFGYDGYCRDRGLGPGEGRMVRFRAPQEGVTGFEDLIRGSVRVDNSTIEDFGLRKSNGDPLFIVANVVDDAEMAISHVIRGEDHVSNTHKYVLLWEALDYGPRPVFAHLPLLLNESRKKLSKRRDRVAVEDYRDEGYLPDAFVNYLALLGWSPGDDREILSRQELIEAFRLEEVKSAGAIFDQRKLAAVNAAHLRRLGTGQFVDLAQAWLQARWEPLAGAVQERARTLSEVYAMTQFLFGEVVQDLSEWRRLLSKQPNCLGLLGAARACFEQAEWQAKALEEATASAGLSVGVSQLGKAQAPIRLAVTGRTVGPPLWESLEVLGRERTLRRLEQAQSLLEDLEAQAGPQ